MIANFKRLPPPLWFREAPLPVILISKSLFSIFSLSLHPDVTIHLPAMPAFSCCCVNYTDTPLTPMTWVHINTVLRIDFNSFLDLDLHGASITAMLFADRYGDICTEFLTGTRILFPSNVFIYFYTFLNWNITCMCGCGMTQESSALHAKLYSLRYHPDQCSTWDTRWRPRCIPSIVPYFSPSNNTTFDIAEHLEWKRRCISGSGSNNFLPKFTRHKFSTARLSSAVFVAFRWLSVVCCV